MFKNKILGVPGIANLAVALLTLGIESVIRNSKKECKSKDSYINAKYKFLSDYYGGKQMKPFLKWAGNKYQIIDIVDIPLYRTALIDWNVS